MSDLQSLHTRPPGGTFEHVATRDRSTLAPVTSREGRAAIPARRRGRASRLGEIAVAVSGETQADPRLIFSSPERRDAGGGTPPEFGGRAMNWWFWIDYLRHRLGGHRVLAGARCRPQGPQLLRLLRPQPLLLPARADPRLRGQGPGTTVPNRRGYQPHPVPWRGVPGGTSDSNATGRMKRFVERASAAAEKGRLWVRREIPATSTRRRRRLVPPLRGRGRATLRRPPDGLRLSPHCCPRPRRCRRLSPHRSRMLSSTHVSTR